MGEGALAITLADVEAAAGRIEGEATVTPVHTSRTMDGLSGRALFFKCELFQCGGVCRTPPIVPTRRRISNILVSLT